MSSPFDAILGGDDPFGLLDANTGPQRSTEDEIVLGQFEAINAFVDAHGVEPGTTAGGRDPGLGEIHLESQLEAFRESAAFRVMLAAYDRHGLLGPASAPRPAPRSMDEILATDDPWLQDPAENIFALTHVTAPLGRSAPDEVAQRRACDNFADYAPIFAMITADLASGRRITKRFESEKSIEPGRAFILHGLIAYVVEMGELFQSGEKRDARLRVVYANGTESNHLSRSFARSLYYDDGGRQIIETAEGPLFRGEPALDVDERLTGTIYVVESLSSEPSLAALRGRLYKIGFTTQPVEDRLRDVAADPTFLLAPVRIVTAFDTINLNPRKLEGLLHTFFGNARLRVDVLLGRTVNPREWFVLPIDIIREAVTRMIDGSIVRYRYDHVSRKIIQR
jgi:hypothetical protein